jgi:ankyrin repeat protein
MSLMTELEGSAKNQKTELTLLEACEQDDLEHASYLLNECLVPIEQTEVYGPTPLLYACQNGNLDLVRLLLHRGANVNRVMVVMPPVPPAPPDSYWRQQRGLYDGVSPLFIACENRHSKVVRLLLDWGADVDLCRTDDHMTPLLRCCSFEQLAEFNRPPMTRFEWSLADLVGEEPIVIARMLLEYGADVEGPDLLRRPPLWFACHSGWSSIVELLLEYGATTEPAGAYGGVLMRLVCNSESPDTLSAVNALLKKGVEIEGAPGKQESPLVSVCAIGNVPVIKRLLAAGARAVPLDGYEGTPLSYSMGRGDIEAVETLLSYGACDDGVPPELADFGRWGFENRIFPSNLLDLQKRCIECVHLWPDLRNQISVKLCIDRLKRDGYDKVVQTTPTSELPQHLFVFKVIEMMKMCGMEPLAEELVEYIGR